MTNSVDPEVHTLTGAYVCDALDEAERSAFEAHMAQCEECASEVAELREVAAVMGVAAAERPPTPLKDAVDARIRVTRQAPPIVARTAEQVEHAAQVERPERAEQAGQAEPRRHIALGWRAGWAVAAALALVVAGVGWKAIDQQHRIDALNSSSTQITQLLAAPDAYSTRVSVAGGGSALLVDSRSRDEAAIAFSGLAQAPAGKTYQLWLMTADGSARSEGLMQVSPSTPVIVQGLSGEAQVGMTVEPAGGSARPTTVPIMVAALGT
jgi:anti-sigma-K factor RskA